jgi:hypothetical protein
MRKQLTGEPVAGKLHTGFGGRGRCKPFPTPIQGAMSKNGAANVVSLEAGLAVGSQNRLRENRRATLRSLGEGGGDTDPARAACGAADRGI